MKDNDLIELLAKSQIEDDQERSAYLAELQDLPIIMHNRHSFEAADDEEDEFDDFD